MDKSELSRTFPFGVLNDKMHKTSNTYFKLDLVEEIFYHECNSAKCSKFSIVISHNIEANWYDLDDSDNGLATLFLNDKVINVITYNKVIFIYNSLMWIMDPKDNNINLLITDNNLSLLTYR